MNLEERLTNLFPKSYKYVIKVNEANVLKLKLHKEYTEFVNSEIDSNMEIAIYTFSNPELIGGIFTIPGIEKKDLIKEPSVYENLRFNLNLYKMKITGKLINNRITIMSQIPNSFLPIFFENSSLKKIKTKSEILAICLHEIGHWVNYRSYFPDIIARTILSIQYLVLHPLVFLPTFLGGYFAYGYLKDEFPDKYNTYTWWIVYFIIIGICMATLISALNIKNEYNCDRFVKEMGKGEDFKKVLIKDKKLIESVKLSSIQKRTLIMVSLIAPVLTALFWFVKKPEQSISTHPHNLDRVAVLSDNTLEYINQNRHLLYEHFSETTINNIEENIKDFTKMNHFNFVNSFKTIVNDYDQLIFDNRKILFPMRNIIL